MPQLDLPGFNIKTCESCHDSLSDTALNTENGRYCLDCLERCPECDEHFEILSAEDSDGNSICESCGESYSQCSDCNDVHHIDDLSYSNDSGEPICDSCVSEYFCCEACSRIFPISEYAEDTQCTECYNASSLVHEYNFKPEPVFFGGESNLYLGMEIETESNRQSNHDDAIRESELDGAEEWYCKHDSSLRNGFEVVSHPGTLDYWMEYSFGWVDELRNIGYRSFDTDTCGMHIHINRSALTQSQTAKLLLFFKRNVNFINTVSRRNSDNPMSQWARIQSDNVVQTAKGRMGEGRYVAINLTNTGTIEFRIFRGTLKVSAIKRNLLFVASLVAWIRQANVKQINLTEYTAYIKRNPRFALLVDWIESCA